MKAGMVNKLISCTTTHTSIQCCGCSSCALSCPKGCITMQDDSEGFFFPKITNPQSCVNCGICDNVCPVLHPYEERLPQGIYAYKSSNDDVRYNSSSGGFFYDVALKIINAGGVVFGVMYDEEWMPVYTYVESIDKLQQLQGSKYVQVSTIETYPQIRAFLDAGRTVLFTGTPCQVSGLKHYLRKDYPKLYTMDVVCHAVPSPMVWKSYLQEVSHGKIIKSVNMRDKSTGWSNYTYSCCIQFTDGTSLKQSPSENIFMRGFTSDLYNRLSCAECQAKNGASGSDITIGDFWGIWNIAPLADDNKGTSLVLVNTEKGAMLLNHDNCLASFDDYKLICQLNKGLTHTPPHSLRNKFFKHLFSNKHSFQTSVSDCLNYKPKQSFWRNVKLFVESRLRK